VGPAGSGTGTSTKPSAMHYPRELFGRFILASSPGAWRVSPNVVRPMSASITTPRRLQAPRQVTLLQSSCRLINPPGLSGVDGDHRGGGLAATIPSFGLKARSRTGTPYQYPRPVRSTRPEFVARVAHYLPTTLRPWPGSLASFYTLLLPLRSAEASPPRTRLLP